MNLEAKKIRLIEAEMLRTEVPKKAAGRKDEPMVLMEDHPRKATSKVVMEAVAENLAKESLKAYKSRTLRETEEDSTGTKAETHYMKGVFVNEDLNWKYIEHNLKGYTPEPNMLGTMIERKMGIKEDELIFPPKAIIRDFSEEGNRSNNESFCTAEIRFDPKLMYKKEAISYLATIRREANEDEKWASDLTQWLQTEEEYNFYYVIEFEIICEFNFKKYWCERFQNISPDAESQLRSEGVSIDSDEERKEILKKMHREVAELAKYVVEYVVEKVVFYDLRNAFKHMCEEIEKDKQPTDKQPTDKQPLPENRFLFYNPMKLKLAVTLNPNIDDLTQVNLGDQIEAEIRIESEGKRKPDFHIDESFKVIIEGGYFEAETKEITFAKDPIGFKICPKDENRDKGENQGYCVKTTETLTPQIGKITEEYKAEYPLNFVLKRSTGILSSSEETVFEEDVRPLAKCEKKVVILPPIVSMTRTKKRLLRKGEQFDIKFNLECKGNNKKLCMIPLTLRAYFGKTSDPDFEAIGSESETTKNNTATGYYSQKFDIKVNGDAKETFTLMAKRASFYGYFGIANFKLEVPNWKTIREWRENIIVFPNFVDTFIAGTTTLLGIAYLYRPDWFPFIANIPALNIANLEAIPAIIYLGYRVLNWTRATTAKATSGGT